MKKQSFCLSDTQDRNDYIGKKMRICRYGRWNRTIFLRVREGKAEMPCLILQGTGSLKL